MEFEKYLNASPVGVLASRDGEKVRTRVFQYLFADGNKIYFSTGAGKSVYSQLKACPEVSFCCYTSDFSPVLSINGRAVFVEDAALKARTLDENPQIKSIYGSPDNPGFKMFYIDADSAETFSFAEGTENHAL